MNHILDINAHLKYIEFVLHSFDNESGDTTIGELRKSFQDKFNTLHPLLNQHFGICRLLPLILMKQTYTNQKVDLIGDVAKIKVIRDAIAHDNFLVTEQGYLFKNNKDSLSFSYSEFNEFLYRVENQFYSAAGS